MIYTEEQLNALIQDVEKEFGAAMAKAEAPLAAAKEDPKPEDKKADQKPEDKKPEAKPEADKKPGAEQKPEGEQHDYSNEDVENMHKMYHSMSKAELGLHHDSIRKAMECHGLVKPEVPGQLPGKESEASHVDGLKKSDGCGGEMSKEQPGDALGAKSEASRVKSGDLNKTETGKIEASQPKDALGAKSEASRVKSGDLNKSEENPEVVMLKAELEANKAKSKELKDSLDTVATILTQMVKKTAPQGKAVMSLDVVRKSEVEEKPLSKSEVTAVLAKKAMDPSLSKQDRNLINAFYLDNASINSISHLLR